VQPDGGEFNLNNSPDAIEILLFKIVYLWQIAMVPFVVHAVTKNVLVGTL
jgi:hypothetical protein